MSMGSALGALHAAAAILALTAGWRMWRARGDVGQDARATGWLVVALGSVAVWSAHLAWYLLLGASSAQVLWLPAVGASFAALLAWTVATVGPERATVRVWLAIWLLDPVLLVGVHLLLGPQAIAVRTDHSIDYGWFYTVHTLICFAMILAAASLWAGCRADPSRTIRALGATVLIGLLATGAAQALQLMLLDIAISLTCVVSVVVVVRAGPATLRAHPRADALLDDVGALVLVYDRNDRLVHLSTPAREFFSRRGAAPPASGTPAGDSLPVPIDRALEGVDVQLTDGDDVVDFACLAARLSASTWPPEGSVVVLRPGRSTTTPSRMAFAALEGGPDAPPEGAVDGAVDGALAVEQRIEQLAAATTSGTLVALGVRFVGAEDAARAAHAIEFVVGSFDSLVIGLVDERSFVAVAPAHLEPLLVDVAADWHTRSATTEPSREEPVRHSVSLSPVLSGDVVVQHGLPQEVSALVASVRQDLAGSADR
ncbi:hypothetical protein BH11ACT8_BH11ACT8_04760 [soil metagenome]